MSTNYYAIILPSKERKNEFIDAVNNDDVFLIQYLYEKNYSSIGMYNTPDYGIIHIGKRSGGWKFLWDPNIYGSPRGIVKYYDFNKKSIRDFLSQENVKIIDEYYNCCKPEEKLEHTFTVDEFMEMALNWCPDGADGTESPEYVNNNPLLYKLNIRQIGNYFFSDGLRFAAFTDFS